MSDIKFTVILSDADLRHFEAVRSYMQKRLHRELEPVEVVRYILRKQYFGLRRLPKEPLLRPDSNYLPDAMTVTLSGNDVIKFCDLYEEYATDENGLLLTRSGVIKLLIRNQWNLLQQARQGAAEGLATDGSIN